MSINCCVKIWWNLALINSTSVKLLNTFQVRLCVEKVNSRQERLLKICSISVSDHRQVVGLKLGCWTESLNTSHYKNSSHNERKHRSKIPEHILQNTLKEKKSHLSDRGIDGRIWLICVLMKDERAKTHQTVQTLVERVMNVRIS